MVFPMLVRWHLFIESAPRAWKKTLVKWPLLLFLKGAWYRIAYIKFICALNGFILFSRNDARILIKIFHISRTQDACVHNTLTSICLLTTKHTLLKKTSFHNAAAITSGGRWTNHYKIWFHILADRGINAFLRDSLAKVASTGVAVQTPIFNRRVLLKNRLWVSLWVNVYFAWVGETLEYNNNT